LNDFLQRLIPYLPHVVQGFFVFAAGACVGTCAAVRDDAVRIEWLDSVRVLCTSA
jgi:hypothetical protein